MGIQDTGSESDCAPIKIITNSKNLPVRNQNKKLTKTAPKHVTKSLPRSQAGSSQVDSAGILNQLITSSKNLAKINAPTTFLSPAKVLQTVPHSDIFIYHQSGVVTGVVAIAADQPRCSSENISIITKATEYTGNEFPGVSICYQSAEHNLRVAYQNFVGARSTPASLPQRLSLSKIALNKSSNDAVDSISKSSSLIDFEENISDPPVMQPEGVEQWAESSSESVSEVSECEDEIVKIAEEPLHREAVPMKQPPKKKNQPSAVLLLSMNDPYSPPNRFGSYFAAKTLSLAFGHVNKSDHYIVVPERKEGPYMVNNTILEMREFIDNDDVFETVITGYLAMAYQMRWLESFWHCAIKNNQVYLYER